MKATIEICRSQVRARQRPVSRNKRVQRVVYPLAKRGSSASGAMRIAGQKLRRNGAFQVVISIQTGAISITLL